jgi:hypothetical protein
MYALSTCVPCVRACAPIIHELRHVVRQCRTYLHVFEFFFVIAYLRTIVVSVSITITYTNKGIVLNSLILHLIHNFYTNDYLTGYEPKLLPLTKTPSLLALHYNRR